MNKSNTSAIQELSKEDIEILGNILEAMDSV